MRTRSVRGRACGFAAASMFVVAGAARADDAAKDPEKEALAKRLAEVEKKLEEVTRRLESGSNKAGDELTARVEELEKLTKKDKDGLFGYWKNGIRMDSSNGAFKLKIGGFFQNDWSWFWDTQKFEEFKSTATTDTQINAGTEFRRARLSMGGTIYSNIDFNAEYDFAGGAVGFRNVWLGTNLCNLAYFQVGSMKEPFGLEELTPDLFVSFLERSAPSAVFAPAYNTGFMLSNTAFDDRLAWAIGAFRDAGDNANDVGNATSGEVNYTARVAGRPWVGEEPNQFIHLGAAGSLRRPSDDTVRYSARPELRLAPVMADTLAISSDQARLFELESAAVFGPFSAQAEYYRACVEDDSDGSASAGQDSEFHGWAVQATFFVTGESRGYDAKKATFTRVTPKKNWDGGGEGWGALELAARLDGLDLNDGPVEGGKLRNFTVGMNWYLNPNTKVALDWVHSRLVDVGTLNGLEMRFQIDF
jgi:phosphate-selective porin OprO/OprP